MIRKNLVAMMVTVVMVAGALVGCGSKEVPTVGGNGTTTEASAVEATVEENAVDAAASTEESIVEETVVEEVEPQTKEMKVLAGYIRLKDGAVTEIMSYMYDESGNPVKVVSNDIMNDDCFNTVISENFKAEDLLTFGDKYAYDYAEVTKSENGKVLECDWYSADGTDKNEHSSYTYNEFGSEATRDSNEYHAVFTYDESGNMISVHEVDEDGNEFDTTSDNIECEVDSDGSIHYLAYTKNNVEYYYFYATIEVSVQ